MSHLRDVFQGFHTKLGLPLGSLSLHVTYPVTPAHILGGLNFNVGLRPIGGCLSWTPSGPLSNQTRLL